MKLSKKVFLLLASFLCLQTHTSPAAQATQSEQPEDALAGANGLYAAKKYAAAAEAYRLSADLYERGIKSGAAEQSAKYADGYRKARFDYADSLCQNGEWAKACRVYDFFNAARFPATVRYEALLGAAGCEFHQNHFGEAERYLNRALELESGLGGSKTEKAQRSTILLLYRGETYYRQERFNEAAQSFQNAMDKLAEASGETLDYENSKILLAGLSGCYEHMHDYKQLEPVQRTMAILDKQYLGDSDLTYGWSLFGLSNTLRRLNRQEEALNLYRKAIWTFRYNNRNRIARELGIDQDPNSKNAEDSAPTGKDSERNKQIFDKLTGDIFGTAMGAKSLDKDLEPPGLSQSFNLFDRCRVHLPGEKLGAWNLQAKRFSEAPGWVWTDPYKEQKAMLLCVHGLGLHHKAYDSFARRMAREGFIVVSFDVRGFGVFMQEKGHEKLDMQGCVQDLRNVLAELRRDYPRIPIFLLGESMGGALALRVAASDPQLIDGLVCSVPAGERRSETGTKLKVAMKLIANTKKPMDLGNKVVNRSTTDPGLRCQWIEDPSSRLRLTAQELLQFELFMRQNKEVAQKIDRTPVLVFQGDQDRLVKKEGTYDLFESLKTKDKVMVLLGNSEHLIFEANPFKDDITLGVIGWLSAHAANRAPAAP